MTRHPLRYSAVLFFSALSLSGCVTTSFLNKGYQDVQFNVRGAESASCRAHANGQRYTLRAPGTMKVKQSPEPLRVTCSTHNQTIDLNLPATVEEKPVWAGSSDGYALKSMASYPSPVTVDFTVFRGEEDPQAAALPVQQAETAVSAAMLPDPISDPVPTKAAPAAVPAPAAESKGNFMSVLKKLGSDSAEEAEEDSDVVEIKPDGPISLRP